MDQRTRTVKTLACLAAAMTAAAVFLGWIDPSLPPPSGAPSAVKIARAARLAVGDGTSIRAERWYDVEVVTGSGAAHAAPLLAASLHQVESHFVVDPDGTVRCTRRWRRQEPFTDAPHTVRIELARANASLAPTPAERFCLETLVAALSERITPDGPPLPVRVP